jgi:hypothetical protein
VGKETTPGSPEPLRSSMSVEVIAKATVPRVAHGEPRRRQPGMSWGQRCTDLCDRPFSLGARGTAERRILDGKSFATLSRVDWAVR